MARPEKQLNKNVFAEYRNFGQFKLLAGSVWLKHQVRASETMKLKLENFRIYTLKLAGLPAPLQI